MFIDCGLVYGLTRVVEHTVDAGLKGGKDNGIKERVETAENNSADYNTDDDLHTRVNITLCSRVIESGLCGNRKGVRLILDLIKKTSSF